MNLSTWSRYGTHLMLELSRHYNEGPMSLNRIAQDEEISAKYLSLIVIRLKAANLVRSVRGSQGGYQLSRPPSQITLREIVECLEGNICLVACIRNPELCNQSEHCTLRKIWKKINKNLLSALESVTLKDLVDIDSRKNDD